MGCFNHKANFSQLPIVYGDRIVVVLGIRRLGKIQVNEFSPGHTFIPISVPIRGEYNDYGGIENVDRTPGIEVLENFFDGMNVDTIVDLAERLSIGCEDQMEKQYDIWKVVKEKIKKSDDHFEYYPDEDFELSYIMEHERVFDYLINSADFKKCDRNFWMIPHSYIEALGYTKNLIEKNNGYELIEWTHESLPKLKEHCYVWLEKDFGNYEKVPHTITELCKRIKCEVPKEFDVSYYMDVFQQECEDKLHMDPDKFLLLYGTKVKERGFSFKRKFAQRGLFSDYEGIGVPSLILAQFGNGEDHLDMKYAKEVIEIALLLDSMRNLQMTWGETNYYRQEVNYKDHIDFLNECLKCCREKKVKDEERRR